MLNGEHNDYIKTLAYYYIGHFSKTIKPGAVRIAYSKYLEDITITAFKNLDDTIAVVMTNRRDYDIEFNMCIGDRMFKDVLDRQSIVSYVIER